MVYTIWCILQSILEHKRIRDIPKEYVDASNCIFCAYASAQESIQRTA